MFINAEWNSFVKHVQKELHDHHVEASFNEFCHFINGGCALKMNIIIKLLGYSLQIEYIIIAM